MSEPIYHSSPSYPTDRHRHSLVRTAFVWGAVAVVAMVVFGVFAWIVGAIFHLIGLIFEVAVVTAVAAVVWRIFAGRRGRQWD